MPKTFQKIRKFPNLTKLPMRHFWGSFRYILTLVKVFKNFFESIILVSWNHDDDENEEQTLHTFIFALGGVTFVWYVKSSDRIVKRNENGFLFHWGRVIFKFLIGLLETIFYHIFIVISIAVIKIDILKEFNVCFLYISKFKKHYICTLVYLRPHHRWDC